MTRMAIVVLALMLTLLATETTHAGGLTFEVNSTANFGDSSLDDDLCDYDFFTLGLQCTLRAAIEEANDEPGTDQIHFNVSPGGVQTIFVSLTELPAITEAVIIDGTTQPACPDQPCIVINGSLADVNTDGLVIQSDGSTIRGLVINQFKGQGIYILPGSDENTIVSNYLGTDVTGMLGLGNHTGLVVLHGSNNTVGGASAGNRNVISGNGAGVSIAGEESNGNVILGNYIGVGADGETPISNVVGIQVQDLPTSGRARIGAAGFVADNTVGPGNVISGNTFGGVCLCDSTGTLVAGNLIGTDASGQVAVPNVGDGVLVRGDNNVIGGDSPAARNVISGNGGDGVRVNPDDLAAAIGNEIRGNYIGVDITGEEPLGNGNDGVRLIDFVDETGETRDNIVEDNVIGANLAAGVSIFSEAHNNHVLSNFVGITPSGDPMGNAGPGVLVSGASSNQIGSANGEGNVIAYNGGAGVEVRAVEFLANDNTIRGNSIYSNDLKGIEISDGANDAIAPPVIGPLRAGVEIAGAACPDCTVDVYSDDEDEGRIYEGAVTADGSGNWSFSEPVTGPFTTATATDAGGSTSEFSDAVVSPEPPTPTPTPEATATTTPTPFPTSTLGPSETPGPTDTPTPTGTPSSKATQGDTDCDEDADSVDALFVLREVAGFEPSKCIDEGDVDCDEDRDSVDALGILRHVAALPPLVQQEPCADIGTQI